MSPQEDEASMSEEQHFYLAGENWTKDETNDLVPPNKDMTWIATVLEQKVGGVNRILILLNQAVNARHGRPQKWLDASTYPSSWRRRKLPISSEVDFKYEIHENAKERRQESTKVSVFRDTRISAKRVEDDSNQDHDKEFRRYTLRIAFRLGEDNDPNSAQLFVRANISSARKPVNILNNVLGGPVTSLLEFLGTPYSSKQSNQKSEEQVADEILQPKEDPKVKKISELVASANNWARSKRKQFRSWLSGKPTRSLLTASSATLIAYVVGIGIVWLRVIDNSHPSIGVQYLTFILVCFAPFAMLRLQKWMAKNTGDLVDHEAQKYQRKSGHYVQAVQFQKILIASIFGLVVYIAIPAIAWPTVKSSGDWHWLWSDRQTLGLLATLMLGVLSTVFSNSVRELSLENSGIRNDVSDRVEKLRTLTEEIQEASHRLWSEYETHIKDFGKVFLFRANDFAHMAGRNDEGDPIDPVLKGLNSVRNEIMASDSAQDLNEDIQQKIVDWLNREHPEHDWEKESSMYFKPTDFDLYDTAPNFETLQKWARKDFDRMNSTDADADADKKKSRTKPVNEGLTTCQKLAWIVKKFVASDDGRFAVRLPTNDLISQRLMLSRRIYALTTEYKINDSSDGKNFRTYGYFPTDESVTLSFIQAMRRSKTWCESASGEGMEDWLKLVYTHVQKFGIKNRTRFEQIEALIRSFDQLASGTAISASLFLDDLILFLDIMRTGTDDVLEEGESLSDQQDQTLARILTYASVFYHVQVWCRNTSRKPPSTFPSPFRAVDRPPLDRQEHETDMFEKLREALIQSLEKMTSGKVDEILWPSILELSNRQGPTTNFMRAARAFVTREKFLDSKDFEMRELEIVDITEEKDYLMTKFLFNDDPRSTTLIEPMPTEYENVVFAKHRPRLKVARKSNISSFCESFED